MDSEQPQFDAPDHTRVQFAAVVQAVIAVLVAFGVDISDEQSVALLALSGILGSVLIAADAAIRRERARNADKLRPHASIVATQGAESTEVTATVNAPLPSVERDDLDDEVLELLRRILAARQGKVEGARGADAAEGAKGRTRSRTTRPRS